MIGGESPSEQPGAPSASHSTGGAVRVGISGLFLRYPHTGTGRYARRVLEQIGAAPDVAASVIIDGARSDLRFEPDREGAPTTMRFVRAPGLPLRADGYARKLLWEQVGLRVAARRIGVDVLYSPHFSLPVCPGMPSVISVHDLIPLTEPGYAETLPTQLYFRLVAAAARQATLVTTLSEYSRGEIVRLLRIPRERVRVIPPGIEAEFNPVPDRTAALRARSRLALPDRYLLYVGGSDTRKNIGALLHALARLRDVSPPEAPVPRVVIAAAVPKPAPSAHHPDWRGMAASLGVAGQVHFIERIAEEDLPAVYRGATAFLFPSRAEGFGLTPVEAMACGTPVVCSDATSLPEAVGDAGILVAPDDPDGWARAIARIAADAPLRGRLRDAGLQRAGRFTWCQTGVRVVEVIREAAACGS